MEENMKFSLLAKDLMAKELEGAFKNKGDFIIINYMGLSSNDINSFRKETYKSKMRYIVVKNRVAKRVFDKLNLKEFAKFIEGGCGIAFIEGDAAESAKVIFDFAKKFDPFKVAAGYIDGKGLGTDRLKELSMLPPKNVLLAIAFSTLKSPITGFATVLGGVARKFVYAISAIKEKKEKG